MKDQIEINIRELVREDVGGQIESLFKGRDPHIKHAVNFIWDEVTDQLFMKVNDQLYYQTKDLFQ
jgi:hypothetical protein